MKRVFCIILLQIGCQLITYSQKDTTIYFTKLGEQVFNMADSWEFYQIHKGTELNDVIRHYRSDNSWKEEKLAYKKLNDTTYQIKDSENNWTLRKISKVDTGYLIKDIEKNGTWSGFSKMIYPTIKEGTWIFYQDNVRLLEYYYHNNRLIGNVLWNDDGSLYYSNVFSITDTPVYYKGGELQLVSNWIASHIEYPEIAAAKGITGKVFVQFVLTKEGNIEGIKVVRSVYESLDNEAKRVIRLIPNKWTVGTIDGRPVNCLMVVPINFQLE